MALEHWTYKIEGTAADGQTWETHGALTCAANETFGAAMAHSFVQLTEGKAIFGKPGVGCKGPYKITRVLIEEAKR